MKRMVVVAMTLVWPGLLRAQTASPQVPQSLLVPSAQTQTQAVVPQILVVPMAVPQYAQTVEVRPPCLLDRWLAKFGRYLATRDAPRLVVRQVPVAPAIATTTAQMAMPTPWTYTSPQSSAQAPYEVRTFSTQPQPQTQAQGQAQAPLPQTAPPAANPLDRAAGRIPSESAVPAEPPSR